MSESTPRSLPWRSVYPKGSEQNCSAVSAGDHYVFLNTFKNDDRQAGTVAMHQEYADFIACACNNHTALVNALKWAMSQLPEPKSAVTEEKDVSDYDEQYWIAEAAAACGKRR